MVAVVLGLAPETNHLFTHTFTPAKLDKTFGVGIQASTEIREGKARFDSDEGLGP